MLSVFSRMKSNMKRKLSILLLSLACVAAGCLQGYILCGGFSDGNSARAAPIVDGPEVAVTVAHGECYYLIEVYNSTGHVCYVCDNGSWVPIEELCEPRKLGDLDGDGDVDLADYAIWLEAFTG